MKLTFADLKTLLGPRGEDDRLRLHGRLEARLYKADGSVLVRVKDNLIVDTGFSFIAQSVGLPTSRPNVMSHIGVGTGTTAAATGNTALVT